MGRSRSRSRSRSRDRSRRRSPSSPDRDARRHKSRSPVRRRDEDSPPRRPRDERSNRSPARDYRKSDRERDYGHLETGGRGDDRGGTFREPLPPHRDERGRGGRGRGDGRGRGRGRGQESDDYSKFKWGQQGGDEDDKVPEKEPEPDFGLSGALAAETNTVNGIVMIHQEPPEARIPTEQWRLYVFKNGEAFGEPLRIYRESCYLFGRERKVAAIPTDHPSCSKQHAVIQYRLTEKEGPDGMMHAAVRPYIMDLGSTNGTFLNNERLDSERYYELLAQDMIRFGTSSREYVLLKA